MKYYRKKV